MHSGRKILRFGFIILACLSFFLTTLPAQAEDSTVSLGVGDTTLTVSGRTSPGAFVTILSNGAIIGTVTADSAGNFSHTFTAFPPGISQIGVYARDLQGRSTSPAYKEINVTEHAHTSVDFFLPTTLAVDNPTALLGTPIYLRGATIPGGSVIILIDDVTRATVVAAPDGTWQYVLETTGMTAGNHTMYAMVNDPVTAEQSYPSTRIPITLIAPASLAPFLPPLAPPIALPAVPVITYPIDGSTVEGTHLTVRGRAEPGTRVELFNGSTMIGSTFANSNGDWEIVMSLGDPSYTIRARACRLLTCSGFSAPVHFFWRSAGQLGRGLFICLEQYWFLIPKDTSVTHNLCIYGGRAPYTTIIDWGDGSLDTLNGKDQHLTFSHTYTKAGQFIGTVTVTDTDGAEAKLTFTAEVLVSSSDYRWLLWILLIVLILVLLLLLYERCRRKNKNHIE